MGWCWPLMTNWREAVNVIGAVLGVPLIPLAIETVVSEPAVIAWRARIATVGLGVPTGVGGVVEVVTSGFKTHVF